MPNLSLIGEKSEKCESENPAITFDDFWALYPRRVAKKAARLAWSKIPPSQHVEILQALLAWAKVWSGMELCYIAHPASWLNGERWSDELPTGVVTSTSSSHVPFIPSPIEPRSPMPANVAAALARIRAGKTAPGAITV
jgi:hypothetical protein